MASRNTVHLTVLMVCLVGISESLRIKRDELDALRQVIPGEPKVDYPIYSIDILKKLNPAQFGLAPRSKPKKNTGKKRTGKKAPPSSRASGNNNYDSEISAGNIPGVAAKDYPVNSAATLLKKDPVKYKGIQNAPSFLIPKNYPKDKLPPRPTNLPPNLPKSKSPNAGPPTDQGLPAKPLKITPIASNNALDEHSEVATNFNYCRGGSLPECINFCPGSSESVYSKCVESCGRFCGQ